MPPSASAPPSTRHQPRLLLLRLPFFNLRTPPPPGLFSLSSLFLHRWPSPSLPSRPSPQTPPPFSSVMLSPDPRQTSLLPLSLSPSLFLLAVADDMRVLTALTLLHRRWLHLRLHQPAAPCFPTRRSLLPNSPLQPSTSASSFSSVSFSTPQRLSHRRLRSLFPDGLFSSVSPASTPSIIGRILLLRRRSLLPPWPGSCRLPPLVPPSCENASSVPASQSSVNPVVADARSSLPPFSSLSSAAPRLRHCRRGEDCVDLLCRSLPL